MKEELLFCPLGGSGEIGMNMNLFAYGKPDNQKWIIVDVGVTFADDTVPGVCILRPLGSNIEWVRVTNSILKGSKLMVLFSSTIFK